jgi:hypothetical protein
MANRYAGANGPARRISDAQTRCDAKLTVQHQVQLFDNLGPVGILKDLLAQKARLGVAPKRSVSEKSAVWHRTVLCNKGVDIDFFARKPQLSKEITDGVELLHLNFL